MSQGLGISGFLKHTDASNNSGGGKWLRTWKKKGVGEATVWLHTRAPIVPCYSHAFMFEDEYEDKETGRSVPTLRWPRFVSPDAEVVHKNQYFRNDDGTLQVQPDLDPFLLLREWLRFANHLALDQPIFTWQNPKERETITWYRGEISGLEKRGQKNFGHSLDTKLEYIYVVVDNDAIADGPVLAREGKLLSTKIVEVIRQQQKMLGEDGGDPAQFPFAFQWTAIKAASPMNAYNAFKREDAVFSDEVWAQISGDDFPDPTPYGQVADGDMDKMRDAFETAAQVELPLNEIFSDDPAVRHSLTKPIGGSSGGTRGPARQSRAAQARQAARASAVEEDARVPASASSSAGPATPVATVAPKPATGRPTDPGGASVKSTGGAAQGVASGSTVVNGAGPKPRRRKVDPPVVPESVPQPQEEMIGCEDCGVLMRPTDPVCSGCGARYEIEESAPVPALVTQPTTPAAPKAAAQAKPASPPKPKPGAATAVSTVVAQSQRAAAVSGATGLSNCWSCGAELSTAKADVDGDVMCPSCGIDQGDEIPF